MLGIGLGCSQTNLRNKGELLTFNKNGMKNFFLLSDRIPQKLNPIQDKHFRGCSRMVAPNRLPLPKICHTYPTMMKLGAVILLPKEDSKSIWITWHTSWLLLILAFFLQKSANFVISRNTDIDYILIHNF